MGKAALRYSNPPRSDTTIFHFSLFILFFLDILFPT